MKNSIYIVLLSILLSSCGATKKQDTKSITKEQVTIGNENISFKLVVFEPGFDLWLAKQQPVEAYDLSFLEAKNKRYVQAYNQRVLSQNPPYSQTINYDANEKYGLQLNYMLYMYFTFFQEKQKQKL